MDEKIASTKPKPFVFVLMPFASESDDTYQLGIKAAAQDVGAYAERLDEQIFVEGMLDRVFNQIRNADVIVADMTGRNANVFYEVGYAHALDKIVLLLTKNSADIPFDLKHFQHTVYEGSIVDLRAQLAPKLRWAIGESRSRYQSRTADLFSLSIEGRPLVEGMNPPEIPVLPIDSAGSDPVWIEVGLRNDGTTPSSAISHIYLFADPDAPLFPAFKDESQREFAAPNEMLFPKPRYTHLYGNQANKIDAPDGLNIQVRLQSFFPPVPPGAREQIFVPMKPVETTKWTNATYRLRFHTLHNAYDYKFSLEIGSS